MGPSGHHHHHHHRQGGSMSRADRYASQNGRPGSGSGRGPSSDFDSMYTYTPLPLASSNTPGSPRQRVPQQQHGKYTQIPMDNMDGYKSGGSGYNSIRMHLYERPDYKFNPKDIPPEQHTKEEEDFEENTIPQEERAEEWKTVWYNFTQNTTFHGMNKITEATPFILRRYAFLSQDAFPLGSTAFTSVIQTWIHSRVPEARGRPTLLLRNCSRKTNLGSSCGLCSMVNIRAFLVVLSFCCSCGQECHEIKASIACRCKGPLNYRDNVSFTHRPKCNLVTFLCGQVCSLF